LITPESFYDKTAPLAGSAGLKEAVRKGLLREATDADADAWVKTVAKSNIHRKDVPPIAGETVPRVRRPDLHDAYVVLKPFTYPAGLSSTSSFFIPKGVQQPKGDSENSTIYDFNTLDCRGLLCE